jgi:hypothetical protein
MLLLLMMMITIKIYSTNKHHSANKYMIIILPTITQSYSTAKLLGKNDGEHNTDPRDAFRKH